MIHLLTALITLQLGTAPPPSPTPDPLKNINVGIDKSGHTFCLGTVNADHPTGHYLCSADDAVAQACYIARQDGQLDDNTLEDCLKIADEVRKEMFDRKYVRIK